MPFSLSLWWQTRAANVKLLSLIVLLVLLCLVYISSTSTSLDSIAARTQRIVDNDILRSTLVFDVQNTLSASALAQKDLLMTVGDSLPVDRDRFEAPFAEARHTVDFLVSNVKNPDRKKMIASISMDLATYQALSERAFDLSLTGHHDEALALSQKEIAETYDRLKTQLSAMIESYKGDIDENRQRMLRESGSLQIGQILLAVFSLPIACFIAWFSIR